MDAIAGGRAAGAVVRGHYPVADCARLVDRFVERGLIRDPDAPASSEAPTREDVGTSLSNLVGRGSPFDLGDDAANREAFLAHAETTRALFAGLFEGLADPVAALYDGLRRLFPGRQVMVAREPDGRRYGPAIFRVHYGGHTYLPHTNHVRLAEGLHHLTVSRFTYQFAALISIRNGARPAADRDGAGAGAHATIYRTPATPEVRGSCEDGSFDQLVAKRGIDSYTIEAEPGDFYLFNSGLVHEVPAVRADQPRVVLAAFVGYSVEDDEVFVWA